MAVLGTHNPYTDSTQCTWYACQDYHAKTGNWTPWLGDAYMWAGQALAAQWNVSGSPPNIPSICCLQPGVQGADPSAGHVCVVESVSGGTVMTSNLNWGLTAAQRSQVTNVQHTTGPGVSFIWAGGGSLGGAGSTTVPVSALSTNPNSNCVSIPTPLGDYQICLPDFSWLTSFFNNFTTLFGWLSNPVRIIKMFAGIACILAGILIIIFPDVLQIATKAAMVAA